MFKNRIKNEVALWRAGTQDRLARIGSVVIFSVIIMLIILMGLSSPEEIGMMLHKK